MNESSCCSTTLPAFGVVQLQFETKNLGNSLVVQGSGLNDLTARVQGLIPGQGTKILQVVQHSQKKKKKKNEIRNLNTLQAEGSLMFANWISLLI